MDFCIKLFEICLYIFCSSSFMSFQLISSVWIGEFFSVCDKKNLQVQLCTPRSDFPRFAGPQLGRGASGRGWLVEHPNARHSLIPKTTNSNSTPLEIEITFV